MSTWLGASCVNLDTGEPERETLEKAIFAAHQEVHMEESVCLERAAHALHS